MKETICDPELEPGKPRGSYRKEEKACKPYPSGFPFFFSNFLFLWAWELVQSLPETQLHGTPLLHVHFPVGVVTVLFLGFSCPVPPRKSSVGINAPCHLLCTKVRLKY